MEDEKLDFYEKKYGPGYVFYPERNNESWELKTNQDCLRGVIACGRPVLLVSHILNYGNEYAKITGTSKEILWLIENCYEFETYEKDPRFFIATRKKICKFINLRDFDVWKEQREGIKKIKELCSSLID